MSITVKPESSDTGAMCKAELKYDGDTPPVPNDVHIEAKHDDGTWHAVTGYEIIPSDKNPKAGFNILFSGDNPNVGGTGERYFRVRWTLNGKTLGDLQETMTTLGTPRPLTWWERFIRWLKSFDWPNISKKTFDALGKLGKKNKH